MSVGDGHRERVSRVRAGDFRSGKQARNHRVDLRLLGSACADHCLLHQRRSIFADRDSRPRRAHQHHSARLAELQRRLRVLVDEDLFDRRRLGCVLGDERLELAREIGEPLRKRCGRVRLQLAVGDVGKAIAVCLDQPPAGRAQPGVQPVQPRQASPAPRRGRCNYPRRSGRHRPRRSAPADRGGQLTVSTLGLRCETASRASKPRRRSGPRTGRRRRSG